MWYLDQGIQEWTKQNLWKAAFKKFEVIWSAYARNCDVMMSIHVEVGYIFEFFSNQESFQHET